MPETILQAAPPAPLTTLTEDEILFRDNIRQFADEKVRPLVKEMDEKGVFDKGLLHDFFQLGLMGIEIPEQYGGGGAKFFEAILAVEELSRVDASSGVIVDVQNTWSITHCCAGEAKSRRKRYLPRMASEMVGAYALSEAGSGSDAFALQTRATFKGSEYVSERPQALDHEWQRSWTVRSVRHYRSGAGYKGITAFLIEKDFPGFTVGQERRQARHSRVVDLRTDPRRLPRAQGQRSGRAGQRLQDRY